MRILVVEDNNAVARVLKHMFTSQLNCTVDLADSLASARTLLDQHRYFCVVSDLHLPDAPHGESVELVLSYRIPCIVLTASLDPTQRRRLLQIGIVDYVFKESRFSYEYVVKLIRTLSRNSFTKVLVADDSALSRHFVRSLLELHLFDVLEAENGAQALEMLACNTDIRLLITDYNMPGIDGFELILRVREKYSREEMAIIGLSSDSDQTLSARFIKNGANDFLQKPFVQEEFHCRVSNTLESLDMVRKLWEQANLDYLTGVYSRRYFFDKYDNLMSSLISKRASFSVALMDIDFFKRVNDTYGHDAGDAVLKEFAKRLKESIGQHYTVARFGGEEFAVAMKGLDKVKAQSLMDVFRCSIEETPFTFGELSMPLTVSIGVAELTQGSLDGLMKRADLALYQAKSNGRNQVVAS